jgi:hypothetical protein
MKTPSTKKVYNRAQTKQRRIEYFKGMAYQEDYSQETRTVGPILQEGICVCICGVRQRPEPELSFCFDKSKNPTYEAPLVQGCWRALGGGYYLDGIPLLLHLPQVIQVDLS